MISPKEDSIFDYVVITPVRDEEVHLGNLIDCMVRQTIRPVEWIIVNDGSHDRTKEVALIAARENPWIKCIDNDDRGFRKSGSGVVQAFNRGMQNISAYNFQCLAKVDADVTLPTDYFEKVVGKFRENSRLGIASGILTNPGTAGTDPHSNIGESSGKIADSIRRPLYSKHTLGAGKIYRMDCFRSINGLRPMKGWDVIDDISANIGGWETCSFDDIQLSHERAEGEATSVFREEFEIGKSVFRMGYLIRFVALRALKIGIYKPYFVRAFAYCIGYVWGFLFLRSERLEKEFRKFLRNQQRERLRELFARAK